MLKTAVQPQDFKETLSTKPQKEPKLKTNTYLDMRVKTMCSRINIARDPEIESDKNLSFAMAVSFCDNQPGRLLITRAEGDAK